MYAEDGYLADGSVRDTMMAPAASNPALIQQQPRRQSARPIAPPPILSTSSSHHSYSTHVYASRQQFPSRTPDGHSGSDSNAQFAHYQPRQSVQGDLQTAYARPAGPARRPMNPPSLNLPTEGSTLPETPSPSTGNGRPPPSPNPPTPPTSPPRTGSSTRPSSRRALVAALSLAQEAVKLDTAGNDPQAAADAYARSVVLLREVMSRVSSGESAQREPSANNRRSSRNLTPREEEVRRLKSIVSPIIILQLDHELIF